MSSAGHREKEKRDTQAPGKAVEGAPPRLSTVIKKRPRGWASNPLYLVVVKEATQVEITLARHDDCWAKQKEQVRPLVPNPKP